MFRTTCVNDKKEQNPRFDLQELQRQFLVVYHYIMSKFLFHEKGDLPESPKCAGL